MDQNCVGFSILRVGAHISWAHPQTAGHTRSELSRRMLGEKTDLPKVGCTVRQSRFRPSDFTYHSAPGKLRKVLGVKCNPKTDYEARQEACENKAQVHLEGKPVCAALGSIGLSFP